MDILKLYMCFNEHEKKQLFSLLKNEKIKDSEIMSIESWCDKYYRNVSLRLSNILKKISRDYDDKKLICDITKDEFLSYRFSGQKSWDEFVELRGY